MKKQRRKSTNVLVGTLAVLLGVTGTFAWQSISQEALNVKAGFSNPGGRLHDDFNGTNKDVYVENFMTAAENGENIYARVRLREYMEYGEDAGKNLEAEQSTRKVTTINSTAESNDKSTWAIYKMEDTATENKIREYFTLKFGGETVYMPTFNKNRDSLSADINGTYEGVDGNPDTGTAYDDYHEYTEGETKTADEYYDADDNDVAEAETLGVGDTGTVNTNHTVKASQEHTAKKTMAGSVISMADWKALGSEPGAYWVYDTDGWAYWALPIEPDTATGLLLDEVVTEKLVTGSWYYMLDVQGQFVTADDMGSQAENDGFYADGFSADAQSLMNKVTTMDYEGMSELEQQAREVVGTTRTITVDGIEWYVLAMENSQAMVWAKDPIEEIGKQQFHTDQSTQKWEESSLKTYMNNTWLPGKTELSAKAVAKPFKTREGFDLETFVESTDSKVFLLSEADLFGTQNSETAQFDDYTYQGKRLVTNSELLKSDPTITTGYWLRSPSYNVNSVSLVVASTGNLSKVIVIARNDGVRPALWLNLAE